MTREEEIKQAAIARYGDGSQYEIAKMQAFCVGARWADKTMLSKAVEWLTGNVTNYMVVGGTGHWCDIVRLVTNFKKAMEE